MEKRNWYDGALKKAFAVSVGTAALGFAIKNGFMETVGMGAGLVTLEIWGGKILSRAFTPDQNAGSYQSGVARQDVSQPELPSIGLEQYESLTGGAEAFLQQHWPPADEA